MHVSRQALRPYPLDGAQLYFQPSTGTNIRIENEATRVNVRSAPRVAMFGITNHCNLTCDFCSRDLSRTSGWTVDAAAKMLRGLSDAGTLEVAFGGGEPFVFRGFADLIAELAETTPLAMHVTTNGTLIRESTWGAFRSRFGQVRLSLYDTNAWRTTAAFLASEGQRWGANVLIDDDALTSLPALLEALAALACHDVSLLSFVGADVRRQLSTPGEARLAHIIADSPVACRLSVCLGNRVASPRLFSGADNSGDCGAGYDFVSITPDRRMQSCSFQNASVPIESAEDVLTAWRERQAMFRAPSPRHGCARASIGVQSKAKAPAISVWQAYSGNNSGECIMVAKFESTESAESYLAELLPKDAETWRALFEREAVSLPTPSYEYRGEYPSTITRIGTSVVAEATARTTNFLSCVRWRGNAEPSSCRAAFTFTTIRCCLVRCARSRSRRSKTPRFERMVSCR